MARHVTFAVTVMSLTDPPITDSGMQSAAVSGGTAESLLALFRSLRTSSDSVSVTSLAAPLEHTPRRTSTELQPHLTSTESRRVRSLVRRRSSALYASVGVLR